VLPIILIPYPSFSSYAPSDLFVLLSWSCGIYTVCLKTNPDIPPTQVWRVLVGILATLFDLINGSVKAKPSLKNGALVRVRRALRSVCFICLLQILLRLLKLLPGSRPACDLDHHAVGSVKVKFNTPSLLPITWCRCQCLATFKTRRSATA